jgi:hypothetical protein
MEIWLACFELSLANVLPATTKHTTSAFATVETGVSEHTLEPLRDGLVSFAEKTVQVLHNRCIFVVDEGTGTTFFPNPPSSAYPVHIVIYAIGQVIVDDVRYVGDVESSSSYVRSYEDRPLP